MKAINYDTLKYLKALVEPNLTIVDLEVKNKWLIATLSSGATLGVINEPFKK